MYFGLRGGRLRVGVGEGESESRKMAVYCELSYLVNMLKGCMMLPGIAKRSRKFSQ